MTIDNHRGISPVGKEAYMIKYSNHQLRARLKLWSRHAALSAVFLAGCALIGWMVDVAVESFIMGITLIVGWYARWLSMVGAQQPLDKGNSRASEERYRNIFQTAMVSIWEEDYS